MEYDIEINITKKSHVDAAEGQQKVHKENNTRGGEKHCEAIQFK